MISLIKLSTKNGPAVVAVDQFVAAEPIAQPGASRTAVHTRRATVLVMQTVAEVVDLLEAAR